MAKEYIRNNKIQCIGDGTGNNRKFHLLLEDHIVYSRNESTAAGKDVIEYLTRSFKALQYEIEMRHLSFKENENLIGEKRKILNLLDTSFEDVYEVELVLEVNTALEMLTVYQEEGTFREKSAPRVFANHRYNRQMEGGWLQSVLYNVEKTGENPIILLNGKLQRPWEN